jgi:hypothetical protein
MFAAAAAVAVLLIFSDGRLAAVGQFIDNGLSAPSSAIDSGQGHSNKGIRDNGRGGNTFVNDPCLDPPPTAPFPENMRRTVQSETEIAVLNTSGSMGKKMVAGYNDSWGFYDNTQGLSGFAYSVNGGNTWIDGGGLPPLVPAVAPFPAGTDRYFGDPVVVVHHQTQTFYFASIYQSPAGYFTISVNRGRFTDAPPPSHPMESIANTRCLNDPTQHGVPDTPHNNERIVWDPPSEAVIPPFLGLGSDDFLDKEWLYVDQRTGTLYVTYTRFTPAGETPIEMVRCVGCAFSPTLTTGMWTTPTVIIPNEAAEFNQATQPFTTPTGRVIVVWFARQFVLPTFVEVQQRIEYAYSDDDGVTFTPEQLITVVNPQREPAGYNRARPVFLNAPYIVVDQGEDDGVDTPQEARRPGFGNVYVAYFSGRTPLGSLTRAADIFVSTSTDDATSFGPPVKVNDDVTNTTHVFPTIQANKHGDVYAAWIDRRRDPEPFVPGPPVSGGNILNDTWAAVSKNAGLSFGHNKLQSDVSTSWFTRADARPNYGDYNSSELLGFNQFVITWADGRFPPGTFVDIRPPATTGAVRLAATPDTIFTIANGLGAGNDPNTTK